MMNLDYLEKNVDITSLSNFKTPAIAKFYFEINSRQDIEKLSEIYKFSQDNNLGFLLIGGGTNLLFAFDEFNGIVVNNKLSGWTYNYDNSLLESYTNELISDIAEALENEKGQDLWHRFIGLPGSIGGAVFGNAGCFGLEAENNFLEAEVYNYKTGQFQILGKQEMGFEYRNSKIKKESSYFIISVKFDLSQKIEKYESDVDNLDFRENKQPKGNTCGSFFKNTSKEFSAGRLIEEVGLKGFKKGGAYFSEKHANFLMNDGSGSYKDLLNLISLAQEKVEKEKGIVLVPEVRIIFNK